MPGLDTPVAAEQAAVARAAPPGGSATAGQLFPAVRLPDVLKPGIHCVRTRWIRGSMTFRLARRIRTVVLMVRACPDNGFLGRDARPRPTS